jgi:hypothetical protein
VLFINGTTRGLHPAKVTLPTNLVVLPDRTAATVTSVQTTTLGLRTLSTGVAVLPDRYTITTRVNALSTWIS